MQVIKQNRFRRQSVLLAVLFSVGLAGCTVQTEPTTLGERSARAAVDKAALFGGQEDIIKPVTLYEAIARAVKYNSDQRVVMMEQAIAYGLGDADSVNLLPDLALSGGFSTSSDRLAVSAKSVANGAQTLPESYIEDKSMRTGQLQIVYNVLDFGISYVNAKQLSDRQFVSEEIRRKSVQQIVHDVRSAYWKAAAAQRVIEDMAVLIGGVQDELVRVGGVGEADASVDQLNEQKKLLTALKSLMDLRNDILTAKADLATLMNLPPNTEFVLDIPAEMDNPKIVRDLGQIDLEHFALVNRPELRINDYEARIAEREAKKEILRLFPGIEFSAGINYNSNSYLKNKNWADAGIGVTWNLMNLFTRPQAIRMANDKKELERMRRLAMTMAVMSQVNVSYLHLRQAAEDYDVANSLDKVNDGLWRKAIADKTKTVKERRETLLVGVDRLVSQVRRDFAYADYKGAESTLFVALGVDPLPRFLPNTSVQALAETLEDNLSRNAPRGFKEVSYDYPASVKPRLTALGKEERAKVAEWSVSRVAKSAEAPLANRAVNNPVVLGKVDAEAGKPVAVTAPIVGGAKRNVKAGNVKPVAVAAAGGLKLLQMSSFEELGKAQLYWQELVAAEPEMGAYSPIFREVTVAGKKRYRTFVADTEAKLKALCRKLAEELKSCLIFKQ